MQDWRTYPKANIRRNRSYKSFTDVIHSEDEKTIHMIREVNKIKFKHAVSTLEAIDIYKKTMGEKNERNKI